MGWRLRSPDVTFGGYFLGLDAIAPGTFVTHFDHDHFGSGWLVLSEPIHTLVADQATHVPGCLEEVEAHVDAGCLAAGYLAYEAAPSFDTAFEVQVPGAGPLAEFHIYQGAASFYKELGEFRAAPSIDWAAQLDKSEYLARIQDIKTLLSEGVTYQVNFTFRLEALAPAEPAHLFATLVADQPPPYGTLFLSDRTSLISLSPELFFESQDGHVRCRPMKGTSLSHNLTQSEKDRAENVMVVDMIRNDLGRIAKVGSVRTTSLFDLEHYPSLNQMTSTVEADSDANLKSLFEALFPCSSIVGAPKVSTMRQIKDLESSPRGVYTGAIGLIWPGPAARFSVGIRTIEARPGEQELVYGVGSGIVWDSDPEAEWDECLLKAKALEHRSPPFGLLETMRWSQGEGYWLLDLHLERLGRTAHELGWTLDPEAIDRALGHSSESWTESMRVRLVVPQTGPITLEAAPLGPMSKELNATLAAGPVRSGDLALRIKSNRRWLYDQQLRLAGTDEVLLWNERQELTEFCQGNLVLELGGTHVTPPLSSGLLPGTFREHLLHAGELVERVVSMDDLLRATRIWRINSVRGWQDVRLLNAR